MMICFFLFLQLVESISSFTLGLPIEYLGACDRILFTHVL